ncbi:hypothetical protein R77555_00001 [Ralstonia mannitolilytica]|nr:hypothetical protein R77555_00001 [Ralstonia mannitolilytica]
MDGAGTGGTRRQGSRAGSGRDRGAVLSASRQAGRRPRVAMAGAHGGDRARRWRISRRGGGQLCRAGPGQVDRRAAPLLHRRPAGPAGRQPARRRHGRSAAARRSAARRCRNAALSHAPGPGLQPAGSGRPVRATPAASVVARGRGAARPGGGHGAARVDVCRPPAAAADAGGRGVHGWPARPLASAAPCRAHPHRGRERRSGGRGHRTWHCPLQCRRLRPCVSRLPEQREPARRLARGRSGRAPAPRPEDLDRARRAGGRMGSPADGGAQVLAGLRAIERRRCSLAERPAPGAGAQ